MGYFFSLSKSTASTALDVSEWTLLVFGLVLVVGIFGEYKKLPGWLLGPKPIFEILVMVGVAGELLGDGGVFVFSRLLQSVGDHEIAELRADAESSKAKAKEFEAQIADSNARAKAAEAQVASAMAASEAASAKAEGFRLDKAKAQESAAKAGAQAAEAQLALEQFKAPRTLSDAQLKKIGDRVKDFSGQEFDVTPYWDLKESLAIANRVADAFMLGGWKYVPPAQLGFMLGGIAGVQVWVHPAAPDRVKKAAEAAVAVLNDEGIEAEIRQQNPNNPIETKIHLNVGTKP